MAAAFGLDKGVLLLEYIGTTIMWLLRTGFSRQKGEGVKHLPRGINVSAFMDRLCYILKWKNCMNKYS